MLNTRKSIPCPAGYRSLRRFRVANTLIARRSGRAFRLRRLGVGIVAVALPFLVAGVSVHAEELVLQAGETRVLPAGNHRFEVMRLGQGATIELTGTTRVMAEKLVTAGDASIRYQGSDTGHDAKFFDFVVVDGQGMQGTLLVDGSGKSRPEARHGDTRERLGGNGEPGTAGEAGMNMDLTLFEINPDAHVRLVSRGGRGGKGGDGGTGTSYVVTKSCHEGPLLRYRGDWDGFCGGFHLLCRDVRHGGRGGDGANGGAGGNAGRIRVFVVHRRDDSASALLQKFMDENVRTEAVAGKGGEGGAGGSGQEGQAGRAGVAGGDGAASEPVKALLGARDWLTRGNH